MLGTLLRARLAAVLICLAGGLGSIFATGASGAPRPRPGQFLEVEPGRHHVDLTLLASRGNGNGGFNFDGYGRGELVVTVPKGWRITVHFENDGARLASCAVVSGPGATTVAFAGASTPDPVGGLPSGQKATFSFRATRTGSYRFASMVPGQEQARMWDVLDIVPTGRPSISARSGP